MASPQPIRISLRWLFLGIIIMFCVGFLGGFVGQYINSTNLPPLSTPDSGRLITTVEQVTISPSMSAAQLVEKSSRSVMLVAHKTAAGSRVVSTGLMITSDGLLVTTEIPSEGSYVAIDEQGGSMPLERVGTDALYGLTYFRLRDKVIVPLEIAATEPKTGVTLLSMGRSINTLSPLVHEFHISEYILPTTDQPYGWQRLLQGSQLSSADTIGSPLLDDEGKIAALVINPSEGIALPAPVIKESLERVIANNREANIFTTIGFIPSYTFIQLPTEKTVFAISVLGVTANTPAGLAGLKTGDVIISINNQPLAWDSLLVKQLSQALPLDLTIMRQGSTRTLTINRAPTPTP